MSGRQTNGWGECVWCGEQLKPEDKEPHSDLCEFCEKWNNLAQLVIKRKYLAIKHVDIAKKENNQKALEYWDNKFTTYEAIHIIIIDALNLKKQKLWEESY